MTRLTLDQIRDIQIEILNELDDFCKENGITYFLCNGTLLGAVKYQGYIPWDDDIDVCLLREDYERLLRLYSARSSERFELLASHTTDSYFFPFAKLSDRTTRLVEANLNNGVELGVNIDIFPIDNYGNTEAELKRLFRRFCRLRKHLNWSKMNRFRSSTVVKTVGKWVLSLPYRLVGSKYYCCRMERLAVKREPTEYVGDCVWGFYGIGEAHKRAVFSESVPVLFEGREYPAPIGYDAYLHGLYGDYRLDPPPEKQCTHHSYEAYQK